MNKLSDKIKASLFPKEELLPALEELERKAEFFDMVIRLPKQHSLRHEYFDDDCWCIRTPEGDMQGCNTAEQAIKKYWDEKAL